MKSTVDPAALRRGDAVRFGSGRGVFTVERFEEKRPGCAWLIVYGPLGSPSGPVGGGQAKYVGPRPTSIVDPVTGKRRRLKPERVRIVGGA
jgi:hypothetical protein